MTQLEAGKAIFDLAGYVSFLLWRSVYITKQVSTPWSTRHLFPALCLCAAAVMIRKQCTWLSADSAHRLSHSDSCWTAFQVSTRNRVLILFDWVKTRVFGRDLSVF